MPEGLQLPDGQDVPSTPASEGEATFAAAMAAVTEDIPAPPPAPAEPKKPRGRPRKDQRASGDKPAPKAQPKAAKPVKADYTEEANSLVTSVWTMAASIPPTQPYAFALSQSADALIPALAEGARHNAFIRNIVDGGSGNMWQLQLAAAGMQLGMTALAIARDPQMKEQARQATQAQIAAAMQAHGIDVPQAA